MKLVGDVALPGVAAPLKVCRDQVVLGSEIGVHGGFGDVGSRNDQIDAGGMEASFVEQSVGGGQNPFEARLATSLRCGRGPTLRS